MLAFLFAFVAVQLAVALWVAKRIRSEEDFLVAGRQLGPVLAATSIFATWFGAESCVGAAGAAYEGGLSWNAPEPFAYGACLILTGCFFAAKLWRLRITTMADFLRGRFGPSSERLAAILLLPSSLLPRLRQEKPSSTMAKTSPQQTYNHMRIDLRGGSTRKLAIGVAAVFLNDP